MAFGDEGNADGYYFIQAVTASCASPGVGTITVHGVRTNENTRLTLLLYKQGIADAIATYEFGYNTSGGTKSFENLGNGTYTVEAYPSATSLIPKSYEKVLSCGNPPPAIDDLVLTLAEVIKPSANGENDGKILTFMSGTNTPISARLGLSGPLHQNLTEFPQLTAGTYTIYAQDIAGYFRTLTVTVENPIPPVIRGCMDPNASNYNPEAQEEDGSCVFPPEPSPEFYIPELNTLRFVLPVLPDNRYIFNNFTNTLYCREQMPTAYQPNYYQKIARTDLFSVQFRSNYATHRVTLHQHTGDAEVKEFTVTTFPEYAGVQEAYLTWTEVVEGRYYVQIVAEDANFGSITAISEPFLLKDHHKNTCLITYRNSYNKFDLVYATNLKNLLRVESAFYKRQPSASRSVYRNCNGQLVKLNAAHQRRFLLETFRLPPWLHEKLVVILDHDQLTVNGTAYQTDSDYEFNEPEGHALTNGKIVLEQVGWFGLHDTVTISPPPVSEGAGKLEFNDGEFN